MTIYRNDTTNFYGIGSCMAVIEREKAAIRQALYHAALYTPLSMAMITDYKPLLEKTMTIPDAKPLSHSVQLLVNALTSAKNNRDSYAQNAGSYERQAGTSRKSQAEYEAKVVELTKALKKLGHKV